MPVIISRNAGTPERRNAGTPERRNAGTPERRAWIPLSVLGALLALALLLSLQPAMAQTPTDYDDDEDGLIDVRTPAQFDAIRHDLNGNGDATHADYVSAFPDRQTGASDRMGCPSGTCTGYELRADLDLSGYANWTPIGTDSARFSTQFEGNGHTIANLTISNGDDDAGLFGNVAPGGNIRRVGVVGANVTGTRGSSQEIGILVGENRGVIRFSYTTGAITASSSGSWHKPGGLVGQNRDGGHIFASYSTATVAAPSGGFNLFAGGLVGHNGEGQLHQIGHITAAYATGAVSLTGDSANNGVGGLVGYAQSGAINSAYATGRVTTSGANTVRGGLAGRAGQTGVVQVSINRSYYDSQRTGQSDANKGLPKTTRELQGTDGYEGLYAGWNENVDGVAGADDPWDFGGPREYPRLRVDFNNDGTATWEEFGRQQRYTPPGPPPYNWRTDHPEIYANARTGITAACEVVTTGTGDAAVTTSTLTFDLAEYARPITLALSLWDKTHFRSLQSLGLAMPALQREGQTATVEVVTDPARTRFRLDGPYGLNLVLGYADCHTDDS